ncbi:SDR family oxidoreductase [Virgibacillus kimchii]
MKTLFFTSYPGFLADNLLKQVLLDEKDIDHVYLLVLPEQKHIAAEKITYTAKQSEKSTDTFSIITGDITKENLNLDPEINEKLTVTVTHVFHLAAIYDLAVEKELAINVNLHGTEQVNNWVGKLKNLERYIYFSTAYVSGTREGRIYEHELKKGQSFRNHYEYTKYEAEILVESVKQELPTTIIRPGVVRGHSVTGETSKFDGIYFMLNLLDRLRYLPTVPYFSKGTAEGNFVPYDYVLKAASFLSFTPTGEGKTYHLTDPNPYTMKQLYQMLAEAYLDKTPSITIPSQTAKTLLSAPALRQWLRVEKEALDYFTIHSSYDTSQASKDLAGSGIVCPDFKQSIGAMVAFYRKYKDDSMRHIYIS